MRPSEARWQRGVAALLIVLAMGCSAPADPSIRCVRSAIVGGASQEAFLGLTEAQLKAIVHVQLTLFGAITSEDCSGVIVTPGAVLTALHCTHGEDVVTAALTSEGSDLARGIVLGTMPDRDLLLLGFDTSSLGSLPLPVARGTVVPGELLELAGYGRDASGNTGKLRFAVESVASGLETTFTVSSAGLSGACNGDSGGPAMRRGVDGRVEVVGMLSAGSAGCLADDTYVMLSGASAWIASLSDLAPATAPCPTYGERGRCYSDLAVWCEAGVLTSSSCDGGQCGWSVPDAGYRCLSSKGDPCAGVPELGVCDGDDALFCLEGKLQRQSCAQCGASCGRLPETGAVGCYRSSGS